MSVNKLPASPESELAVVAAMLLGHCHAVAASGLLPEDFYGRTNRAVFNAAIELAGKKMPVDTATVTDHMRQNGTLAHVERGSEEISALTDYLPTSAHLDYYISSVRYTSRLRKFIFEATRMVGEAYRVTEDGVDVFVETSLRSLISILGGTTAPINQWMGAEIADVVTDLLARQTTPKSRGVLSGFRGLDDITGGFRPGNLSIVAARPHVGKTAWMLQVAAHMGDSGTPVLIFSVEQPLRELAERRLAAEAKVPLLHVLGDGRSLTHQQGPDMVRVASKRRGDRMVLVDESSVLNIADVRARTFRWAADESIPRKDFPGVVMVDYLQLLEPTPTQRRQTREDEIASVSRGLKALAKDVAMPVIALAQLNRAVETRGGSPKMSDLRSSGQMEQDADFVGFLWRPDAGPDGPDDPTRGRVQMLVEKNRSGPCGAFDMEFSGKYMTFTQSSHREVR